MKFTNSGPIISDISAIKHKTLVTERCKTVDGRTYDKKLYLYRKVQSGYVVPRTLVKSNIRFNATVHDMQGKLTEYQQSIATEILGGLLSPESIKSGHGGVTLIMPPGTGKTYVAAYLCARLSSRCLWIVHNRKLMEQTQSVLAEFLCNNFIDVMVINSALKADFSKYDTCILDEVHRYCTPCFCEIFWHTCFPVVVGMTATLEREDNRHGMIPLFIGPIIAPKMPKNQPKFNIEVRKIVYRNNNLVVMRHEVTGKMFMPYMYKQFCADVARRNVIVGEIRALYNDGHFIYVFCEELQPLIELRLYFSESLGVDVWAPEIADMTGAFCSSDQQLKDTARVILTTYGYGGTGVSIAKMTAIVFLTPRKANMMQICGRILRGDDVSKKRIIVDVVDDCMRHQWVKRKKVYHELGASVVTVKNQESGMPK